jgi:hypothetical protein
MSGNSARPDGNSVIRLPQYRAAAEGDACRKVDHTSAQTLRRVSDYGLTYQMGAATQLTPKPTIRNVLLRAFEHDFCAPTGTRRWIDHFKFVACQCDDSSLVHAFGVRKKVAFRARDENVDRFVQ